MSWIADLCNRVVDSLRKWYSFFKYDLKWTEEQAEMIDAWSSQLPGVVSGALLALFKALYDDARKKATENEAEVKKGLTDLIDEIIVTISKKF